MSNPRARVLLASIVGTALVVPTFERNNVEICLSGQKSDSESSSIYEGAKNTKGKPDGYGCAFFTDQFEKLIRLTSGSPSLYCGEWNDGEIEGHGNLSTSTGEMWDAEFSQGKLNGDFFFSTKFGFSTIGKAVDNEVRGDSMWLGEIDLSSGNFNEHGPNGPDGIYMSANGNVYVGEFKDGEKHGTGYETVINSHTKVETKGQWNQGILEHGTICVYPINIPEFDQVKIRVSEKFIDPTYEYIQVGHPVTSNPTDLFAKFTEYMRAKNQPPDASEVWIGKKQKIKSLKTDFGDVILNNTEGEFKMDPHTSNLEICNGTTTHHHPGSGIRTLIGYKEGAPVDRQVIFPDNHKSALFKHLPFHGKTFTGKWTDPEEWAKQRRSH
eukprot:TRINITY_DN11376_c0_g1_i1.p1 TRINITY_DN11376_c0_g1~~TRINITY_DN11376_c0_g1_i1.p1  ORF type:complete len:440 (+),score=69.88 TRINITY_DN11376_c0_g1_i1:176-1321(+)